MLEAPHRGQLGRRVIGHQGAEQASGPDGGELVVVSHQHELGPGALDDAGEGGQVRGARHRGFIEHRDGAAREPAPSLLSVEEELGQGVGGDAGLGPEHTCGHGRRGQAHHLVASRLPGLPGRGQGA